MGGFLDPFQNWNGDSSCCNILEVTLKYQLKKKKKTLFSQMTEAETCECAHMLCFKYQSQYCQA